MPGFSSGVLSGRAEVLMQDRLALDAGQIETGVVLSGRWACFGGRSRQACSAGVLGDGGSVGRDGRPGIGRFELGG